MDTHQLQIKLFLAEPAQVEARDLAVVFHGWIQKQALPGELLIDVADYSHVHEGPGAVLIAHESHYALDEGEGRRGLLYARKRESKPVEPTARVPQALERTLHAAQLIAADPAVKGRVRWRTDEWELRVVDRLRAPNNEASWQRLRVELEAALRTWQLGEAKLEHVGDAGGPLKARVTWGAAPSVDTWLTRLRAGR